VIALGLFSPFNDMASEIVVPLIPILPASVQDARPVALGLVEAVADALSVFLKLWSGRHCDAPIGLPPGSPVLGVITPGHGVCAGAGGGRNAR
jgi:hypothetical protein